MLDKSLITPMISGASYTSLVAGVLFLLWKRNQKDYENTNRKLDAAITDLTRHIENLNTTIIELKMELTKYSVMQDNVNNSMKKIEQRVFQ